MCFCDHVFMGSVSSLGLKGLCATDRLRKSDSDSKIKQIVCFGLLKGVVGNKKNLHYHQPSRRENSGVRHHFTKKHLHKGPSQSKILSNSVIHSFLILHIMLDILRNQFFQTAKNIWYLVVAAHANAFGFICPGF